MKPPPFIPTGSGPLAEFARWTQEAIRALQPISAPGMLTGSGPRGVVRRPLLNAAGRSAVASIERLMLVTENAKSLACARVSDEDAVFVVAKPEGFYADGDSDNQLVVPFTANVTLTEVAVGSNGTLPTRNDVRDVVFPVNLTDPAALIATQVLVPSYRNGFSIIYAMLLAEPLDLDGDICTHIDLNIGDVRRWETMRIDISSPNFTEYPDSFAPTEIAGA